MNPVPAWLLVALASAGVLSSAAQDRGAPLFAEQDALAEQLNRYRQLAADEPAADVQARLTAIGDLRVAPARRGDDDPAVAAALRQFQRRHGLAETGVIDARTRAALNVPMAQRAHQIELSLERLRALPELPDGPIVVINIPAFRLWAWDGAESDDPSLSMRVIVGRASNGRTPEFASTIDSVIFRPFWNVPASIARNEILPRLATDPGYLERERMDILKGSAVLPPTPDSIAMVRRGDARLRQRPGAGNSLGLLKLMFPNDGGVYIHGTPSPQLFNLARRDLSHGCMRAEDPLGLAAWLLAGTEWSRARIAEATAGPETRTVPLPRGVPVVVLYLTAFVSPDDGLMYFVPDIYRRDHGEPR